MSTETPKFYPPVMGMTKAAEYLSVSTKTLNRILKKGLLPYSRPSRHIRIKRADLDAYIESRTVRSA